MNTIKHVERVFYMTSQTHGIWDGRFIVYVCGTHYSNDHLVISRGVLIW